ncbi:protein SHORT ROOT IN SALT MEDIUM 1-like [Mercurialis annua]|uniref:protein SHORT ROOT IN SALT MEDIUM 1-like n=1 Tax=Mercurialis annua TaxID=3986 RepID=UPI0021604508|nr:protein SHORT ROOT IN SALT MEDIUM 1-like [Mercurialis annua]
MNYAYEATTIMSGQNGAQLHAAEEREEAPLIFQNGFHNKVGGPSEVHHNIFHADIRRSPEIYQNDYMSVLEIGSSFGIRGRTHSPEIEYSEEDEEDLEEDPEEDPEEDLEEDPEEDPEEALEEELEEDPQEEDFEEEELLDQ